MNDDWYGPDAATFGDRLAAAREAAGMSSEDLARKAGVKHKTIRLWENDEADPRANRLMQVAGMLNVSIMWLLHGSGEGLDAPDAESDLDPEFRNVLTELRSLRAQMLQQAEAVARLEKRVRSLKEAS